MPKNWKGGPFEVFQHLFCRKTWKNWRKQKFLFSGKNLTVPKKTERGDRLGFSNIQSVSKQQKNWRGETIFRKKSLGVPKKIGRGDLLVSPGMVWYARKQEKPFWFSSLDQIVQFGAIIFCRTFKNYFGQFVWIEKKRKATIIVAFHFMKPRLKNGKIHRLREMNVQKWQYMHEFRVLGFNMKYAIICVDSEPDRTFSRNQAGYLTEHFLEILSDTEPDIFQKSCWIPDRTFSRNPAGYQTGHFPEIRADTGPNNFQ